MANDSIDMGPLKPVGGGGGGGWYQVACLFLEMIQSHMSHVTLKSKIAPCHISTLKNTLFFFVMSLASIPHVD